MNNSLYKTVVAIMLIDLKNEVLFVERANNSNSWCMVSDEVIENEEQWQTISRTLKEKLGLEERIEILCTLERPIQHLFSNKFEVLSQGYSYIGESISFYLVRFDGENDKINLNRNDKFEFRNYKWCPIDNIESFINTHSTTSMEEVYINVIKNFIEIMQIISASSLSVFNN